MEKTLKTMSSTFAKLHESGCFVIPNPWDVGSAKYLAGLGFKALATTSAGFAWSKGKADGDMSVDEVLFHIRDLVSVSTVPVNADFEDGFSDEIEQFAENIAKVVQTGVAGFSIEDSTKNGEAPLYEISVAVERIRRARSVIDQSGSGAFLTGRAEGFIRGRPDLADVIQRLQAYSKAGADCLYAPGISKDEEVLAIVQAVAPKPVNFVVRKPGLTVSDLAALGVRRISVGGALARSVWGELMRAAQEIAEQGTFERLGQGASGAELNSLMAD